MIAQGYHMTDKRALELLTIEQECVKRAVSGCDRNCDQCALVQDSGELLEMYEYVRKIFQDRITLSRVWESLPEYTYDRLV